MAFWDGVDPNQMGIDVADPFEPSGPWLFIPMLDTAAGIGDFIGAHRRVTDEHDLIVGGKFMEHIPSRELFRGPAAIVFPYFFIESIMEVEILHMFEFSTRG